MMKILLLGANGQVGWELQRSLAPIGVLLACDRQQADLNDLAALEALVRREQPDVIVNAAAYTAVDKAETEVQLAQRINAEAPAVLARFAMEHNAWLIHYSTDYVFDGNGNDRILEDSPTCPLNIYGKTKLQGEQSIGESGCNHLIFRTSWAYSTQGSNFAKTMLKQAREKNELRVIADQYGAPTSAELIADATSLIIQRIIHDSELRSRASGIYHLVASGETSWHRYAQFLIREANLLGMKHLINVENIIPIRTSEFHSPAKRPSNSRLDNTKLQKTFGLVLPNWEYHVKRMIKEIIQQGKS